MFFLLLLLLLSISRSDSIEIVNKGQIYSPSTSVGSFLFIELFNPSSRSIHLSAVVEGCCIEMKSCHHVRFLGGDFGRCRSKERCSMTFVWPGIEWRKSEEKSLCHISLLYGLNNRFSHEKVIDIAIQWIPLALLFDQSSMMNPFQTWNSPYHHFPVCDQYLDVAKNRCQTLNDLRANASFKFASTLIPFNHQSIRIDCPVDSLPLPINQHRYHPQTYVHRLCQHRSTLKKISLHHWIVISTVLFLLYVTLLILVSILLCSYARQISMERQPSNFSIVELTSELVR